MNCLFIFPGYTCPLSTIQWRTTEDYMVLGYSDETAFVWQIQTAHLDRVLTGKQSRDVLEDDRWPVNQLPFHSNSSKSAGSTKNTVSIRPLVSGTKEIYAHVFTFNIRRLVHDLYTHLVNNPVRETSNGLLIPPPLKPSVSTKSFDSVPEILAFKPDKDDPMDSYIDDSNPSASAKRKAKAEWREKRLELIAAVMTVTMSWQVNEALEDVCKRALNKSLYNGHTVSNGIRSTNGYLSLLPPLNDEKDSWKVSPSMTAVRLLSIALLAKAMIYAAGEDSRTSDLLSGYAMSLPAVIGSDYCFPSLSMLSKYWQDKSARALFSSAVTGLSTEELEKLVHYWETFLPTSNTSETHGSHMMVQAAIILGIMGCDHSYLLTPSIRKSTALSLTLLLSDAELEEPRTASTISADQSGTTVSVARTLASMELLSQGFSTWESYINAAEVLRTLFAYASDTQSSMASINRGAKQAIFHIAIANMPLVLGTLTYDTMHSKKIDERIQCLTMIGYFIRKKPMLLYSSVNRVAEAVVKTLDPNVAHMRESVLQSATSILHHLVKAYPCVDFSGSAQKLAVGTQEGAAVIYDLRTATRSVVLEGHMGPVDALSFSPDAKFIATCCLQDQTVRVWYTNLSLFGMLASSLTQGLGQQRTEGGKTRDNGSSSIQKPYKVLSFANPRNPIEASEILSNVHIEWTSARCVKLIVYDFVMSFPV
ncbi:hypothetical protein CLU79DRAFT_587740 [Phycomyces nitens]|nr:hypothetical protein CLU79DRAFT_587740 [Phycomyces nitens]